MISAALVFILFLIGCMNRLERTWLEPSGAKAFRFVTLPDPFFPEDCPDAEKTRIEWLEESLRLNGCGSPCQYEIVTRTPIAIVQMTTGEKSYRIYYDVLIK